MKKTDSDDDALLEILINVATDIIENHCGRRFLKTEYTNEVYDGSGSKGLLLKNYPIDTSATFRLDRRQSWQNEDSWDEQDVEIYFEDPDVGIISLANRSNFDRAARRYRVTYTAGYAFKNNAATLVTLESLGLGDLELATWMLVKKVFHGQATNNEIQSESIGDYSVTFRQNAAAAMLDPIISSLLQKYVRAEKLL